MLRVLEGYLSYGLRVLLQHRLFSVSAVLSVALATGLNSAILSVVYGVIWRPLPYNAPSQLVVLSRRQGISETARGGVTASRVLWWRDHSHSFDDFAVFKLWEEERNAGFDLISRVPPLPAKGGVVTWNFFDVLGVRIVSGRGFLRSDGSPGAQCVVVISDALWRAVFGGNENILGQVLKLNLQRTGPRQREECSVVGVLPKEFVFSYPEHTDIWAVIPWSSIDREALTKFTPVSFRAVARLKPGVSIDVAASELLRVDEEVDRVQGWTVQRSISPVESIQSYSVGSAARVMNLIAIVGCVLLLVAAANLACLMIGHFAQREREFGIRVAIGAGPRDIGVQICCEATLLILLSGAASAFFWTWTRHALHALVPGTVPRSDEPVPLALGWTIAFCLPLLVVFLGVAVSFLHVRRRALHSCLIDSGHTVSGGATAGFRSSLLVGIQVCGVTILLTAAGLLLRSFLRLQAVDLGFDRSNITVVSFRSSKATTLSAGAASEYLTRLKNSVVSEMRAIPGVTAIGVVSDAPFVTRSTPRWQIFRPDRPGWRTVVDGRIVDSEYFDVMGIRVLEGRTFTEGDTNSAPSVFLISQSLAREAFANETALGKKLTVHGDGIIVGIVSDIHYRAVEAAPRPTVYVPFTQYPVTNVSIVLRSASAPGDFAQQARRAVSQVDPEQPVQFIGTLAGMIERTTATRRAVATIVLSFGVLGLCLAVTGLYGVVSRAATERRTEAGIRMALGATPRAVAALLVYGSLHSCPN